ncbi:hypothetical protein OAQ99_05110 [Candidatus Kapabacteria bacterium]|nr:hypothetical protein [Candidatus Kapabacteria bacterium]
MMQISCWRESESDGGFQTYKNDKDNSTITIKTDGSIVRSTRRRYNKNGARNNRGEK